MTEDFFEKIFRKYNYHLREASAKVTVEKLSQFLNLWLKETFNDKEILDKIDFVLDKSIIGTQNLIDDLNVFFNDFIKEKFLYSKLQKVDLYNKVLFAAAIKSSNPLQIFYLYKKYSNCFKSIKINIDLLNLIIDYYLKIFNF